MKNKYILFLSVILVIAVVGVVLYFISHQPTHQELIPQTFAQLPEKPKLIAEYHNGPRIESVAFSPADPFLIAFADEYGTIRLWNRNNTKEPIRILSHPDLYASISFSPTGELLVSAGWTLILWDVATGMKLNSLDGSSGQFAFSPDGNFLAIPKTHVRLWDIRDPDNITEVGILPYEPPEGVPNWGVRAVDFSPDGKWIVTAHNNGTVNVWDFQSKQLVKTLETSYYEMDFLKFSPDNRFLAAGGSVLYIDGNKKRWVSNGPKGYNMWELPSWQRKGEVQRGNIDNLVFSPDGKICVSANDQSFSGRGIELWAVESGAPVTFLPTQARDVSFSNDGRMLVTGGWDGIIQLWKLTPQQLEAATLSTDLVRIIYYLPKDKEPSPNITQKIDNTIREVQDFYADEMERHGFGRKTFTFETDQNGKAKIYLKKENQSKNIDLSNGVWLTIIESKFYGTYPYSIYADYYDTFGYTGSDGYLTRNNVWRDNIEGIILGKNVGVCINFLDREPVAFTLRGAFCVPYYSVDKQNSLKRFFSRVNDKMPWGKKWAKLSKCEAEWLDRSRFFNPNQPFFDKPPKMDMHVSPMNAANSRRFHFEVADEDGIHQVQLFVPVDIKNQRWRKKFHDCQALNGKEKATVIFEIADPAIETVVLRMMDMHGNIASREFIIKEKTPEPNKKP